jgi:hypothetical protein
VGSEEAGYRWQVMGFLTESWWMVSVFGAVVAAGGGSDAESLVFLEGFSAFGDAAFAARSRVFEGFAAVASVSGYVVSLAGAVALDADRVTRLFGSGASFDSASADLRFLGGISGSQRRYARCFGLLKFGIHPECCSKISASV